MRATQIGPALSIQTLASAWSDAVRNVSSADDPIDYTGYNVNGPHVEFWCDRDISLLRILAGEVAVGKLIDELEEGWDVRVPKIKRRP